MRNGSRACAMRLTTRSVGSVVHTKVSESMPIASPRRAIATPKRSPASLARIGPSVQVGGSCVAAKMALLQTKPRATMPSGTRARSIVAAGTRASVRAAASVTARNSAGVTGSMTTTSASESARTVASGTVETGAPVRHRDRPVSDVRDEREVVCDEEDRAPGASLLVEERDELARVPEVLPERRLVQDQHVRPAHERARDRQPPLLTVGERVWIRLGQALEPEPFEELVRIARRRPASGEGDLFAHRSGEEAALGVLEDVGDARGIDPAEGPSAHGDRASCRRERAREQGPEGAFPRAVRPDERGDLAGADVKRDAGDRVAIRLAIAVRDIAGGR